MKVKWLLRTVIYVGLLLMLTSCWNSRELNDLAIVSAIGIDKAPDKDEYRVTFQLVNPAATATSSSSNSSEPAITCYTSSDRTLFGALRKTSKKASRQLFFAHTQLLVIGESMAKSGINDIFDLFERSHELRLNSTVLLSRNTDAGSILETLVPIEIVPAMGLVKKSENTARVWGEHKDMNILDILTDLTGEGELVISGIEIAGNKDEAGTMGNVEQTKVKALLLMSGLGVFKDGKLQQWMEGSEARGTLWIQNEIQEASVDVNYGKEKEVITVNVILSKTDVKVEIKDGVPVIHLHIEEEGSVNETKVYVDFSKREEILQVEKGLEEKTKAEVIEAFKAAQRMKSDIFNFAGELKRTKPKQWEQVAKEWDSLFATAKLDVSVTAYIRTTGMRINPYISEKK